MEKILITGVGGFIGKELASALAGEGYKVYGTSKSQIKLNNIIVHNANILDGKKIIQVCKNMDYVIHCAAVTEYRNISDFPIESLKTNVIGTYNVLKAFAKSNAKSFIFPSSGKVYGKPNYLPYNEEHSKNPNTSLGKMKEICEELITYFSDFSDKSFFILRLFNVYGQHQKKYFLIPTILSQINEKKILLGDIKSKRDFIYIKDVIDCFSKIIKNNKKGIQIYNVGSGISHSAYEIVSIISRLKNKKFEIELYKPKLRKNEAFEERSNIRKLKNIGWKPKYSLEDGLNEMIKPKQRIN